MKLYVDAGGRAPSPRRVRIYLAEKGLEIPIERFELHVEKRTAEFRKQNVVGTLPVLELDDGTCLSESVAICRYLPIDTGLRHCGYEIEPERGSLARWHDAVSSRASASV